MTSYPGGKGGSGVAQKIINQMPPHRVYIEGCLGGGSIFKLKRPAMQNIGIDVDPFVIQLWKQFEDAPRVLFFNDDVISYIKRSALTRSMLLYLDPPYLMNTRKSQSPLYRCEFGEEEQHEQLLKAITTLDCMVMVSGYWSELYARELKDWRAISFQAMTRGGTMATEWLWMNYPEPMELHDYRFLGETFRQRESIKRQQNRWRARLTRMGAVKRYAMLSVLAELNAHAQD